MRPRLFGMITTEASTKYTVAALQSFFLYTDFSKADRFCLIDNDGAWSSSLPWNHERVEVIKNSEGQGFATNSNYFITQATQQQCDLYLLNNDLIFTTGWNLPLDGAGIVVSSPLSNREVQYIMAIQVAKSESQARVFTSSLEMTLEQYRGAEFSVQALAESHRANTSFGFMPVIVLPYFCVRLPFEILERVGLLDEGFGKGGGEDYDYSLRAHLAGFPVNYVLNSWLIHFYGKSSWSGVEQQIERERREQKLLAHFEAKWGSILRELIFNERESLIAEHGLRMPQNNAEFVEVIQTLRKLGSSK